MRELAKTAVRDPHEISIAANQASKSNISQWLITVDKDTKSALLSHLINEQQWDQALIFIETKHGAAKLVSQLEKRASMRKRFIVAVAKPFAPNCLKILSQEKSNTWSQQVSQHAALILTSYRV